MIRIVVFDLGNVITPFDHTVIAPALHERSRAKERFTVRAIHDHLFDWERGCYLPYEEGAISTADFITGVRAAFDLDLDAEEFKAIWNPIFRLDDEVAGIVEALKRRGVPLFLLSNTNEMHFRYILDRFAILRAFDELIASHEVRMRKPHRAIYDEAIRRGRGVAPDEMLFIDDWEKAVLGAAAAGMQTHHFKGAAGLRDCLGSKGVL